MGLVREFESGQSRYVIPVGCGGGCYQGTFHYVGGEGRIMLHHGDCLSVMKGMDESSIDAVITDPPYGLTSKSSKHGFMKKTWDAGVPGVAYWEQAYRVLKPSHYLLAFGGTRTWHRLACAIEDAGFEMRDTLMWVYSQGFPKNKACLKPAWEPIILARKPGPRNPLGIEDCKVGTEAVTINAYEGGWTPFSKGADKPYESSESLGRWPSNLMFECTCETTQDPAPGSGPGVGPRPASDVGGASWSKGDHVPFYYGDTGRIHTDLNCPCAMLDAQSGKTVSSDNIRHCSRNSDTVVFGKMNPIDNGGYSDEGGASRFFPVFSFDDEERDSEVRFRYCAKAAKAERNAGLQWIEKGDVGQLEEQIAGALEGRQDGSLSGPVVHSRNTHPTVKPAALMGWLIKLVIKPDDTILDPFMGSGSTGIACVTEVRRFVGIDQDEYYVEIAKRRIKHAKALTIVGR